MNIEIQPKKAFIVLLSIFFILLVFHLGALFVKHYLGYPVALGLVPMFHFDSDTSISSYYSALCLLVAGVILANISILHKKRSDSYLYWLGLSLIFVFLSFDEASAIHERLIGPVKTVLNASGYFTFAWIIPYGLATLLLSIAYMKFFIRLSKPTLVLFLIVGGTFLSGAIGFEMISGNYSEFNGVGNLTYDFMTTVEELLEMFGAFIFIYALLTYITSQFESLGIVVKNRNRDSGSG